MGEWLARCADHKNAIALVFARTETQLWIDEIWNKAHSVMFIFGRLTFYHVDGTKAAGNGGAPSALVSYDAQNTRCLESCGLDGIVLRLKSKGGT